MDGRARASIVLPAPGLLTRLATKYRRFKELVDEPESSDDTAATPLKPAHAEDSPSAIAALVLKFHLHPIMAHTPNGILPMALIFLVLGSVFGLAGFENAAFISFIFVLLSMPVVIVTGYMEWQNRYKGVRTKIFGIKIAASMVVLTTLTAMVIWRMTPGATSKS